MPLCFQSFLLSSSSVLFLHLTFGKLSTLFSPPFPFVFLLPTLLLQHYLNGFLLSLLRNMNDGAIQLLQYAQESSEAQAERLESLLVC